jgi:hypothetical protein
MSEINPNHPTTQAVHDQWHKLCALLLQKFTDGHAVISVEDVHQLGVAGRVIVVQETHRGIELTLVSELEGQRLARQHGGLPQ